MNAKPEIEITQNSKVPLSILFGALLILCGCAGKPLVKVQPTNAAKTQAVPVKTLNLAWDPYPDSRAHLVLEQSTDLQSWTVLTNLPWWVSNATVAATGPCGFFRLGADWNR